MTAGRTSNAAAVEALDAQARLLYRRLRDTGPSYAGLAGATRSLHAVLKDLRAEARDLGSLLNTSSPIYSVDSTRELLPLLDESDITLKQVAASLGKYGPGSNNHSTSSLSADTDGSATAANTSAKASTPGAVATTSAISVLLPGAENVSRENDTFALARNTIEDHTTKFISFFETVILRNPAETATRSAPPPLQRTTLDPVESRLPSISPMPPEDDGLDTIKDRVDAIAVRFSHQDLISASQFGTASVDELWQVFYSELIYEGFSTEALSAHQVNPPCLLFSTFAFLTTSAFFLFQTCRDMFC